MSQYGGVLTRQRQVVEDDHVLFEEDAAAEQVVSQFQTNHKMWELL